ncbi:metallophosphoesterase family protein [Microvirga antarctica]|uniref:metallophosphoesterase family protein n=1 Tax=Microvirga antarctica TaxID=2819233 RepID=UPI001B307465|nr:DNA repair exonuclease [Microvirga antarctica]
MRFTFIHAADLHIDSPFAGLGLKDQAVAARFAKAGRQAVESLVAEAIDSQAAFVIIAGDVFDGDWKDVTTGLFFARALGALHRASIPTVMVKGNHDADSIMSRGPLAYPETVRTFASNRAETYALEDCRVALHGRSFSSRKVADDFVASYPQRREGWLNIGVLHTALDGTRGHEAYAPCTVDDLRRFGYDYWALGHIHAAETVSEDPWIVYPGNVQGRSVRETGAKGAVRVTVEDGRIIAVEPLVLDAARWAHETIDVSGCSDEAEVLTLIREALRQLHPGSGGRPLAVRLTLSGTTSAHARLVARREAIEEEARALGFQFADDCWVEQVKLATVAPARVSDRAAEPDALDVAGLLEAAADDPAFRSVLSELLASVADKLPRDLRAELSVEDPDALEQLALQARDYLVGALPS